jgi:hypothetical protein
MEIPAVAPHHDAGQANANANAARRGGCARWGAVACVFFTLCACATIDRLRESTHDADSAGELAQDAAIVGLGYRLFLPGSPGMILLGIAYLMHDPLAPNWTIETIRVREDVFRMQLTMKRRHTGGEGEAQYIFRRNARRLAQAAGYDDYVVLRYGEGIESATSAARRFGEGEIRLIKGQ